MRKMFLIYQVVVPVVILFLTADCKKEEPVKLVELSTIPVINFTTVTAVSGGKITSDGGSEILSNGVCWSTTVNPLITDSKTVDVLGTAQFVSSLSGLTSGTTYHVRAYSINSAGTAYGEDITFTTLSSNNVSDAEGNTYNIITIGVQVWMAENLKTTRYRNGDLIGTTDPATLDITAEAAPKYQWAYNGDESNVAAYGRLYTWYAVTDSRNVCPTGWHAATNAEWTTLTNYLGGNGSSANKLTETGITHWPAPNLGSTNETGFTAIPGGYRDGSGFGGIGEGAEWWTSTEFSAESIYYWEIYNGTLGNHDSGLGPLGFSVRCLRD